MGRRPVTLDRVVTALQTLEAATAAEIAAHACLTKKQVFNVLMLHRHRFRVAGHGVIPTCGRVPAQWRLA